MANLLETPANWYVDPPAAWTGSAYAMASEPFDFAYFAIELTAEPAEADTVSGVVTASNADGIPMFLVFATGQVLGAIPLPSNTPVEFSFAAVQGAWLQVTTSAESTNASSLYGLNVAVTPAISPAVADCQEIGRATRIYASAYQRTRGHLSRLVRGERRCLVVDYNGAIPASRSIASAVVRTNQPNAVSMSNPRIMGRQVAVDLDAQQSGFAEIKVEATLDNGERYPQMALVLVRGAPWFEGEVSPGEGPRTLTATA